jgi:uncharacterized protein with PIN domain
MARLYADEQFPRIATEHLRSLGHDVLTVQEAGNAGKSDPEVLEFAISTDRVILTQNRRDFVKLHRENPEHSGMVICSDDKKFVQLAERIHDALSTNDQLNNQIIRVTRPSP